MFSPVFLKKLYLYSISFIFIYRIAYILYIRFDLFKTIKSLEELYMKFINAKNHKLLYIAPIVLGIISLFLIFVAPKVTKGIDLKGGNQLIIRYEGEHLDSGNLEETLKKEFNLQEININETKGPTSIGLIIEYSSSPEVDTAKQAKDRLDFSNENIEDLKTKIATILTPLIEIGYLDNAVLTENTNIRNKEDLKIFLNENIIIANNSFNNQIITKVKSELNLTEDAKIQTREVSPTLGKDFVRSSLKVGIVALILLSFVIFLFFREVIPSALIIFAAGFDMMVALAGMSLIGLPLSLTTIPTLLMLIGYSVDTDILLTTKILKNKKGNLYEIANKSMKTGMTMTITTLITVIVMLVISYFVQMTIILEIATVLSFGLVGDIVATWFFNAPAHISYVQRKNKSKN